MTMTYTKLQPEASAGSIKGTGGVGVPCLRVTSQAERPIQISPKGRDRTSGAYQTAGIPYSWLTSLVKDRNGMDRAKGIASGSKPSNKRISQSPAFLGGLEPST